MKGAVTFYILIAGWNVVISLGETTGEGTSSSSQLSISRARSLLRSLTNKIATLEGRAGSSQRTENAAVKDVEASISHLSDPVFPDSEKSPSSSPSPLSEVPQEHKQALIEFVHTAASKAADDIVKLMMRKKDHPPASTEEGDVEVSPRSPTSTTTTLPSSKPSTAYISGSGGATSLAEQHSTVSRAGEYFDDSGIPYSSSSSSSDSGIPGLEITGGDYADFTNPTVNAEMINMMNIGDAANPQAIPSPGPKVFPLSNPQQQLPLPLMSSPSIAPNGMMMSGNNVNFSNNDKIEFGGVEPPLSATAPPTEFVTGLSPAQLGSGAPLYPFPTSSALNGGTIEGIDYYNVTGAIPDTHHLMGAAGVGGTSVPLQPQHHIIDGDVAASISSIHPHQVIPPYVNGGNGSTAIAGSNMMIVNGGGSDIVGGSPINIPPLFAGVQRGLHVATQHAVTGAAAAVGGYSTNTSSQVVNHTIVTHHIPVSTTTSTTVTHTQHHHPVQSSTITKPLNSSNSSFSSSIAAIGHRLSSKLAGVTTPPSHAYALALDLDNEIKRQKGAFSQVRALTFKHLLQAGVSLIAQQAKMCADKLNHAMKVVVAGEAAVTNQYYANSMAIQHETLGRFGLMSNLMEKLQVCRDSLAEAVNVFIEEQSKHIVELKTLYMILDGIKREIEGLESEATAFKQALSETNCHDMCSQQIGADSCCTGYNLLMCLTVTTTSTFIHSYAQNELCGAGGTTAYLGAPTAFYGSESHLPATTTTTVYYGGAGATVGQNTGVNMMQPPLSTGTNQVIVHPPVYDYSVQPEHQVYDIDSNQYAPFIAERLRGSVLPTAQAYGAVYGGSGTPSLNAAGAIYNSALFPQDSAAAYNALGSAVDLGGPQGFNVQSAVERDIHGEFQSDPNIILQNPLDNVYAGNGRLQFSGSNE